MRLNILGLGEAQKKDKVEKKKNEKATRVGKSKADADAVEGGS